jgi:RNA polymerase sigma-70 factor (ECF subfamily)
MSTKAWLSDETALVIALQSGQERAVTFWFNNYQPRLHNYVARRIDQHQDIEELVQEVFINCLRNIARFRAKSSLFTWMCGIANHEVDRKSVV